MFKYQMDAHFHRLLCEDRSWIWRQMKLINQGCKRMKCDDFVDERLDLLTRSSFILFLEAPMFSLSPS